MVYNDKDCDVRYSNLDIMGSKERLDRYQYESDVSDCKKAGNQQ